MRNRTKLNASLVMSISLLAMVSTASGKIIYVDAHATGNNDGSSWSDAYNYLQHALTGAKFAEKPVEIRVAQGIYKPTEGLAAIPAVDSRTITFQLINRVTLKGSYAGFGKPDPDARDIVEYETILSGDLNGDDGPNFTNYEDNSYHVVTGSGTNATAVLDGFTIAGGNANSSYPYYGGGGMFNDSGNPTLINCTFSNNRADGGGGAASYYQSDAVITNCTFSGNSGHWGGGIWNSGSRLTLINCTFIANSAALGGGLFNTSDRGSQLTNCVFSGNLTEDKGGGMWNYESSPILANCLFTGNSSAQAGGGGMYNRSSSPILMNCTLAGNSAHGLGSGICNKDSSSLRMTNCILWGNTALGEIALLRGCTLSISYCDVTSNETAVWAEDDSSVDWGPGNIDLDPRFVDPDGADDVIGTEDDNLRLLRGSPCIDAGDNSAIPQSVTKDLDGNPRIIDGTIDMGAYEGGIVLPSVYYVDAVNGDNNNDGLSRENAFATIQKGIDSCQDGDAVLVYPGLYTEEINFKGKAITVQGIAGIGGVAILENSGDFAASFYYDEGPDSVVKNLIIRNSFMGIFVAGSSPTISNVTIADNKYGMEAYAGAEPDVSNCILWNNTDGDLFGCQARYSCIERGSEGKGNIDDDPCFVDPSNSDYHLRSERGRYWPEHDIWVLDKITSPCIDKGDPTADYSNEPAPNGGCINMGAYGGTAYASLSTVRWMDGDVNRDGIINMVDLAMLAENWLKSGLPSNQPPRVIVTDVSNGPYYSHGPDYSSLMTTIELEADAYDTDGMVVKVEFYSGGDKIGADYDGSDGWGITWADSTQGSYTITAKATDDRGATTTSPEIEIEIRASPPPRR